MAYFLAKEIQTIVISPGITNQPDWSVDRISELDTAFERVFTLCLKHFHDTGEIPFAAFRKNGEEACT